MTPGVTVGGDTHPSLPTVSRVLTDTGDRRYIGAVTDWTSFPLIRPQCVLIDPNGAMPLRGAAIAILRNR